MQIEKDTVAITAGVRHGKSLGSPVALVVTMMIGSIGQKLWELNHLEKN